MNKLIKKKITGWRNVIAKKLVEILEDKAIPKAIELIVEDYRFNLNDVVKPKSLLAPERFEDEFRKRLERFEFISKHENGIKITYPDMENFDFSNELDTIRNILEGIAGHYVEVSRKDYAKATKRQTYRGEYRDVYLIRYTPLVRKWEEILDKKFDVYPFSNIPPIDIFGRAEDFIEKNLDNWIDEAVSIAEKEILE